MEKMRFDRACKAEERRRLRDAKLVAGDEPLAPKLTRHQKLYMSQPHVCSACTTPVLTSKAARFFKGWMLCRPCFSWAEKNALRDFSISSVANTQCDYDVHVPGVDLLDARRKKDLSRAKLSSLCGLDVQTIRAKEMSWATNASRKLVEILGLTGNYRPFWISFSPGARVWLQDVGISASDVQRVCKMNNSQAKKFLNGAATYGPTTTFDVWTLAVRRVTWAKRAQRFSRALTCFVK